MLALDSLAQQLLLEHVVAHLVLLRGAGSVDVHPADQSVALCARDVADRVPASRHLHLEWGAGLDVARLFE